MNWKQLFGKKNKAVLRSSDPEWWREYFVETQAIDRSQRVSSFLFKVVDLETTGFDYQSDRIISAGVIPSFGYELYPAQAYHTLIRQDFIKKDGVQIHGLTMRDIQSGIEEVDFLKQIVDQLKGTIIVGHHIGFDVAMINAGLQRHWGLSLINPVIDTAYLYKRCYPIKFIYDKYVNQIPSLDDIAEEFELVFHDRHSALGDAAITGVIFLKLLRNLENAKVDTLKELLQ